MACSGAPLNKSYASGGSDAPKASRRFMNKASSVGLGQAVKRLRAVPVTLGEHGLHLCRPSDHKRRVQYFEGDCWNGSSSVGRLSTGARGESKLLRNVSAIGRRLQKSSCRSERHPATKSGGKSCAAARRRIDGCHALPTATIRGARPLRQGASRSNYQPYEARKDLATSPPLILRVRRAVPLERTTERPLSGAAELVRASATIVDYVSH